ncbi:outer membrane protein assembly factor BamE domain-containing protein [Candidatus Methylacidithermus pantelleriae]|uniref:Outer membrane protein assembly factor BamE, lipoprotein component of the BamABCDE complex n=1 Tax=Candidatus Methylacidithermus pantelleriae TaxID=2744239 RepID=A0A8J2BRG8_9BACT|nr:outer membrane protein assembly factor BamE [Candidatus Methylacidithermus pantelleriae]CAF0691955.1 Outer membrane protein assembly factor BamE, lipoprotein component of the BamABCDE complex [Candidatus Methylacidithermus pantelleriae]
MRKESLVRWCWAGRWGMMGVLALCLGCSRLTNENLSRVRAGMAESEVRAILGEPAEVHSAEAFGLGAKTYVYQNGKSRVEIIFVNGKVFVTQGSFQ